MCVGGDRPGLVAAVGEQLGEGAAEARGVLDAVAAEAVAQDQVRHLRESEREGWSERRREGGGSAREIETER